MSHNNRPTVSCNGHTARVTNERHYAQFQSHIDGRLTQHLEVEGGRVPHATVKHIRKVAEENGHSEVRIVRLRRLKYNQRGVMATATCHETITARHVLVDGVWSVASRKRRAETQLH